LVYMQLGTAFFETADYNEAIPYLSYYQEHIDGKPDRAATYRLAFAHYKNAAYTAALNYFAQVKQAEDTLSQAAALYMAFCQMELDKPEEARMSLKRAWQLNQDADFTKEAHFQYAKASFALNYYSESQQLLQDYLT